MKMQQWIFAALVSLLGHLSMASHGRADTISISVTPSLAPNLTSFTQNNNLVFQSPSAATYISNALFALQNGLASFGGDPSSNPTAYASGSSVFSNDLLATSFAGVWNGEQASGPFAGEYGNFLEFGVIVTGSTNGNPQDKVELQNLSFNSVSTDQFVPGGFFSTPTFPVEPINPVAAIGIDFNSQGQVTQVIPNLDASTPVDEIIYAGIGLAAQETDPSQLPNDNSIFESLGSFTITGTYTYNGNGNTGSGSATVDLSPAPPPSTAPEPATLALLASGVTCALGYGWTRRPRGSANRR